MLAYLEDPITVKTLIDIARIATHDASDEMVEGFRAIPIYVTEREGIVYTPPDAVWVLALVRRSDCFYYRQQNPPAQGMHCSLLLRLCAALHKR